MAPHWPEAWILACKLLDSGCSLSLQTTAVVAVVTKEKTSSRSPRTVQTPQEAFYSGFGISFGSIAPIATLEEKMVFSSSWCCNSSNDCSWWEELGLVRPSLRRLNQFSAKEQPICSTWRSTLDRKGCSLIQALDLSPRASCLENIEQVVSVLNAPGGVEEIQPEFRT